MGELLASFGVIVITGALAWLGWRALARRVLPDGARLPHGAQLPSGAGQARRRDVFWCAPNYADREVVVPSGILVVVVGVGALVVLAGLAAADWWFDGGSLRVDSSLAAAALLLGFGILGYADDRASTASGPRGLGGHLRSLLFQRRLTTGLIKAVGGLVVAAVVVGSSGVGPADGFDDVVVGTLLVALAANFVNLCDRAPGRATKVSLAGWAAVLGGVAATSAPANPALLAACALGAAVGLLSTELDEEHMLGDTGSNALGAAVGYAVVLAASPQVEVAVAAALVVATLVSEFVPFSKIIDAVAPLRWLDRLGSNGRR